MSTVDIKENILRYHRELDPLNVKLVAVSKFHPAEAIEQAYQAGQRLFGESRVDEFLNKVKALPDDIVWHFIGHLQTNKVRKLVGNVSMIESVDSERLLDLIDAESERKGVVTDVLLQLHVAREETKFGFSPDELLDYFKARKFENLKATHLCGVMGMASNTDDVDRVNADFKLIADTHRQILELVPDLRRFDIISMGMSGDYHEAIKNGATHVRIGTDIFGSRQY